jgi:hypothetical protein
MHEMVGYGMIALFIIFGLILWVASQLPGGNGLKDGRRPPGGGVCSTSPRTVVCIYGAICLQKKKFL